MVTTQKPTTANTHLPLKNLVQDFMVSRQHLRPKTLRFYRTCLYNFVWYAEENDWPTDPDEISRDHIRAFLSYVAKERNRWGYTEISRSSSRQASPATVHHYGRVVKILFNWAEEEECLDHNPAGRIKLGSPAYKEVEPYKDEEVYAMLQLCEDDARFRYQFLGIRNKAIVSLFVATGLRLNELSEIRLLDLDPRLKQLRVMGKGTKMRVVPVEGEARKALKRYLEIRPREGEELWKTADGQKLTDHGISLMIIRLKNRARVKGKGGPHRFRHYFATRYLEAGGDLNGLRLLLGHATLYMALQYAKYVEIQTVLSKYEQFNPLDRLMRGDNHNRDNDGWGWRYQK